MDFLTQLFNALGSRDSLLVLLFLFIAWLIGLLTGRWIWQRKAAALQLELDACRNDLAAWKTKYADLEKLYRQRDNDLSNAKIEIDNLRVQMEKYSAQVGQLHADLQTCQDDKAKLAAGEKIEAQPAVMAASAMAAMAGGVTAMSQRKDDLKKVEGIGPKIEQLLNNDGIWLWSDLAASAQERLQAILDAAGPHYRIHDPSSWARQAALASEGKWAELKTFQDFLIAGRTPG